MRKLHYTTQYRKDFKRYKNQPEKLEKLLEVFKLLESGQEIPKELKPHKLSGEYKGCMECYIENDFLLIWFDEEREFIEIVRIGSHSELF